MQIKFNYQQKHDCAAAILTCMDFRFREANRQFLQNLLNEADFDLVALPGAAQAINQTTLTDGLAIKALEIAQKLHQAKILVIINHADCGAYGGSKNFANQKAERDFHYQELRQCKKKLQTAFPAQTIITCYADLDGEKNLIDYQIIN